MSPRHYNRPGCILRLKREVFIGFGVPPVRASVRDIPLQTQHKLDPLSLPTYPSDVLHMRHALMKVIDTNATISSIRNV